MAVFQLIAGIFNHRSGERDPDNGQIIKVPMKRGDCIESDKPLDVLFANKFRRLDGPTRVSRDHDDSLDNSGRTMDKPLVARSRKELKRSGNDGIEDPPMQGDKQAIMGAARDPKKKKKLRETLEREASQKATGFFAKNKDGARRKGRNEEEEVIEAGDEEDEPLPMSKKRTRKELIEEIEDEDEEEVELNSDVEDVEDEEEDEEEEEPKPVKKKKMKGKDKPKKKTKKKKVSDEDDE